MKSRPLFDIALWSSFTIAFACFCNRSQTDNDAPRNVIPADLAPANNEIPGWIIGESPDCSGQGTANDSNELYLIFDGPGEPFARNGFVNGLFQAYIDTTSISTGDTVPMCVQVFNQANHANAVEIYKEQGNNYTPYIPVTSLGDMSRMDTAMTNIILETVHRNYFIRLIVYKRGPPTDVKYEQALMAFGSAIIKRIDTAPTL